MGSQIVKVDTPVVRFAQSFVNLTERSSTTWPAVTSVTVDSTMNDPLTTYYIYDQWAFRQIPHDDLGV